MNELKYSLTVLGLTDYYGEPIIPERYENWLKDNCKGEWRYSSNDAPCPKSIPPEKKPKDWPMFFNITYSFELEEDYENYTKTFC